MIRRTLDRLLGKRGAAPRRLTDAQAKAYARHRDPARRRLVAADPQARPELLYFLTRDASPQVRLEVAANPRTPRQADLILALDESPEVRTLVAEKVTSQLTSIAHDDGAQLWQLTVSILEALARDDLTRVRQLIAESARGMAKLPPTLAGTLARDREAAVAVPALGYPGRLADEELVEVVAAAHDARIVSAVARRPSIGSKVSDAVIEKGDETAIAILLENRTAEIRPQALQRVIDRAPTVRAWHEALVSRPELTDAAAAQLAGFVGNSLLGVLEARSDLDRSTVTTIGALLQERLAAAPRAVEVVPELVSREDPVSRARRLHAAGALAEDDVIEALAIDRDFVIAALSLRARLKPAVVSKILGSQSAKGLTALAWRAGYSTRLALQLQLRVGRMPAKARLSGTGGAWPLTIDEMSWQIEFFQSLVPRG